MDPLSTMFAMLQGDPASAATSAAGMVPGATPVPGGDPMSSLANVLKGIKAPEATKPQFSGGVSGVGLPFLQSMPNLFAPAMNASMQRIQSTPQLPSLGQLLAGGR